MLESPGKTNRERRERRELLHRRSLPDLHTDRSGRTLIMILPEDLQQVTWQAIRLASKDEANDALKKGLADRGITVFEINVGDVRTDKQLLAALANGMHFAGYFGMNWDAFGECLTDMEWLPARGYVLVLSGSGEMWRDSTRTAGKLVESWLLAAEGWGRGGTPFHLVFVL
ncbi:MAG: barstar family protein [Acidobacteriota bacterium]